MTDYVTFNPSAPLSPADMDLSFFPPVFEAKRNQRKSSIDNLIATKKDKDGNPIEYIMAAIIYDSELAPTSTNRKQLFEGGITLPPHDTLSPEETTHYLWVAINGLSIHNIFLTGTDHLTDADLYKILDTRVLDEKIRDIPPTKDMSEFIDFTPYQNSAVSVVSRDCLLPRPNRSAITSSSSDE